MLGTRYPAYLSTEAESALFHFGEARWMLLLSLIHPRTKNESGIRPPCSSKAKQRKFGKFGKKMRRISRLKRRTIDTASYDISSTIRMKQE